MRGLRASSAPPSTSIVLPALRTFRPDLLLISAGFDAHRRDPLAACELETEDFAWATGLN